MNDRFVILGLPRVRAEWFEQLSRWCNSAALPAELLKCVSAAELIARVQTGRTISVALVDSCATGLDRELIEAVRATGAVVIVVRDRLDAKDWESLGAAATLNLPLTPGDVLAALESSCQRVIEGNETTIGPILSEPSPRQFQGRLVGVIGAGGTGTSTVAAALAQGLAAEPGAAESVVLADLARNAQQAMYHHITNLVPGLQEFTEAHRSGIPTEPTMHSMLHRIDQRNYALLIGLRQSRDWTALGSNSSTAAIRSLRSTFRWTVADLDPDLDGEPETGSTDVEERHHLARWVTRNGSVVLLTSTPDLRSIHHCARIYQSLIANDVDASRIQLVITHAPRWPRQRSEVTKSVGALIDANRTPLFLTNRNTELCHRAVAPLPADLARSLTAAVLAATKQLSEDQSLRSASSEPERVLPGTMDRAAS